MLQVGLFDTQGKAVRVQYVSLIESAASGPTPLDLKDALPLDCLLAPVAHCKERIIQAIELLRAESLPSADASLDTLSASQPCLTRGFGGALQV